MSSEPPPDSSRQDRWFVEEALPHEAALRSWLHARFPTIADRDDLLQEAYSRLWRTHSSGPVANPKAFLFVTVRNLALNHLRHLDYERPAEMVETDTESVMADALGIPETLIRKEEFYHLLEAIQSLPERCREVLTMRKIYGLTQKEVAARLDISEHTVEAQGAIGLRKCISYFRHHGYHRDHGNRTP